VPGSRGRGRLGCGTRMPFGQSCHGATRWPILSTSTTTPGRTASITPSRLRWVRARAWKAKLRMQDVRSSRVMQSLRLGGAHRPRRDPRNRTFPRPRFGRCGHLRVQVTSSALAVLVALATPRAYTASPRPCRALLRRRCEQVEYNDVVMCLGALPLSGACLPGADLTTKCRVGCSYGARA